MRIQFISLRKAKQPYKYVVRLRIDGKDKSVRFGRVPYSDFTKHKDEERKERYLSRHRKRENWTRSGVGTAGFWSRWVLWHKTTVAASLKDTLERFNIRKYSKVLD